MQWILADNRNLRFFSFTVFYISQGIPIGLITVAIPPWLAALGASTGEIATFVAVTGLPWGFKLVAGPIMDRFSFIAMGRRRPWVVGGQLGLVLSMLSMSLVGDPVENMLLLTALGTLVNGFAALQDVAVDGMAIDVLPETERGRANAFMAFGQVSGYAAIGALSATLLVMYGLEGTSIVLAIMIAAILLLAVMVRERAGEKVLPWSEGEATERSVQLQASDWASIFSNLIRVMVLPASLLLIFVTLCWRVPAGFWLVAAPVISVQELGYDSTTYPEWYGIASLSAAVLGLLLGPLIDRQGAQRVLFFGLASYGVLFLVTAFAEPLWTTNWFAGVVLFGEAFAAQAVFISFIALHMNICWNRVSATQFAIYMAWANLARSIGAAIYGEVEPMLTYSQEFMVMGALSFVGAAVLIMVSLPKHQAHITALDEGDAAPLIR